MAPSQRELSPKPYLGSCFRLSPTCILAGLFTAPIDALNNGKYYHFFPSFGAKRSKSFGGFDSPEPLTDQRGLRSPIGIP